MTWLTEPFATDFMVRALVGGALVAAICALVGTWVVIRGMAFLGEAMAHGTLPGVAAASLLGLPAILGAAVSALSVLRDGFDVKSLQEYGADRAARLCRRSVRASSG